MARRVSTSDDRGETLVELMVALSIMATAVIALVGGIATSVQASDIHRKQAKSQAYLRQFAENLQSSMAAYPTGYEACTATTKPKATYEALKPAVDAGYQAEVPETGIAVWNRTTSTYTTCPTAGDAGVQRVTLRVSTVDGRASETLDIILRKPCRPPADAPLDPNTYKDPDCHEP
jgi:type II secretory pathway pseudopilin PulG